MNAHIPQSIPTITELKKLATLRNHVISPRLNAPTVTVIQDTLSGVYRLTRSKVKIPEQEAMNMIARWDLPLKSFPRKEYYTGQDMLSFILPKLSGKFGKVLVEMGKVKAGQFDKNALISESALIHTIYNDFGPDQTARFIDQLQALIHKYFLIEGFSVGIEDMLTSVENTDTLRDSVESNMKKAEELIKKVHEGKFTNNTGRSNAEEFEFEIQNITKNITTASTKLVATLDADNRTMAMVNSGAKANEMNVAQMMALLGQQNIEGGRAPYTFEGRTLPHFPKYDDGLESRGFVKNSFLTGLTPFEYFFHAAAGRIGMIDTAVKTSETGYLQRQFMKMMEDLKVEHDGTVRNSMKRMVQFRYGDDGIDPVKIETVEIDLAKMSNADITREYGLSMSDLEAVLTSAALKEVTQPIKDMVSAVRADREMFIKNIIRYNSKKPALRVAVHLPRLLNTYKNTSSSTTDLTPDYVYQKISEFERKSFVKNPAFSILLHYVLAPKKVIVEARLTVELFDAMMAEMEYKYLKALVHPSESVGPVAAQSIGEPTTQLTLNSIEWNERIIVKNGDKIMDVKIGEFIDNIMSKVPEEEIEVHPNDTKLAYMDKTWDALSVDEDGVVSWKRLEAVTRHPPINEDGTNTLVKVTTSLGLCVTATKAKSFLAKSPEGKLEATRGDELQVGSLVPVRKDMFKNSGLESKNDIVWDPVVSIEEVVSENPYVYDLTVADTKNFIHSNGLCLRDTFHVAGTAAANSTSGVPRIKELAAASKNPKTPSNYVYLKGDLVTNKDSALQLKKNIQQTRLKDVLKAVRIYYDPTEESVVEEDKEFMGEYLDAFRAKGGDAESSPWVIRIELNEADLADRAITLEKIKYELEQTSGVADVKVSDTNYSNLVVRVRMVALKGEGNEFFEARKAIYDLENVVLSGVDGINRVFLKESSEEFFYDPVENVYKAKKPWLLETEGANLLEILGNADVDATRSFSNDIMEIQEIFGIEVARQALIDEFRLALGSAYVNVHHVMLLVDTMVQNGYIGPVGRHSMNKNTDIGPLAKASFETSGKVVVEASVAGELDTITGVSSNIMLGQIPPCGTGDVAVFIDESMLPAIKKEVEPELIPVPETGKKELTLDDIVLDLGL